MHAHTPTHLSLENARLLEERARIRELERLKPTRTIFLRCSVRLLLVTDNLSFSATDNFGLGTFVKALLDAPIWAHKRITLANIGPFNLGHVDPSLTSETRVHARIANFRFDDTAHFNPADFDAVFLFGISSTYPSSVRTGGQLLDSEIGVLNAFQDAGGGVFATGDHGTLGEALCSKVARARDMRWWSNFPDSTSANNQVSMTGQRRNDTNVSNAGSNLFDDQSDDLPQTITPRYYTLNTGLFRYRFPHPLLCGPNGVIKVMPDHPHEGECKTPASLDETILVNGAATPEYPNATDAGPRPRPEIIAWNEVHAGRVSASGGDKDSTLGHSFGSICAYDGHRAGVGRVVTDATWHHFVNVNLIGIDGMNSGPFADGFLGSAAGQAAFEDIKTYFRNLMVWLSRPGTISCLRSTWIFELVLADKVLEAVLTAREIPLERISPKTISLIGAHARDVLGRRTNRCQSIGLVVDIVLEEWRPIFDIWGPLRDDLPGPEPLDRLAVIDFEPLVDTLLGGALVRVSQLLTERGEENIAKIETKEVLAVAREGAEAALRYSVREIREQFKDAEALLGRLAR
jgi:hypothetical protein